MLAESVPRGRAGADRSKRADMTGQRGPTPGGGGARQHDRDRACDGRRAPGRVSHDRLAGPGDDDLVHRAAGRRAARRRAAQRAGQGAGAGRGEDGRGPQAEPGRPPPWPRRARPSRTPTARLSTDLVAITAARQASAASASALASGTSCCPVTAMSWAGSGRGGVKTACARGLAGGEHDQCSCRPQLNQQLQAELPTHPSAAHPRRSRSGRRCGRPRRPGRP